MQPKLANAKLAAQLITDDLKTMEARKVELSKQREQTNKQIDNEIEQLDVLIAKGTPTLKQEE